MNCKWVSIRLMARVWLLCLMTVCLSACSLFSSEQSGLTPAPLTSVKQKVRINKLWSHQVGNGQGGIWLNLHPVIDGSNIYAASHSGVVSAFNRLTGKELWSTSLNTAVTGGLAVKSHLVVLGTDAGEIIALNADTGKQKWRANVSGEVLSAPAISNKLVVAQSINGKITVLDSHDGNQIWQQSTHLPVLLLRGASAPVIDDDRIIAGFANGEVVAWDSDTSRQIWRNTIALPEGSSELDRMVDVDSTPLLSDEHLYAVSYQGNLKAINSVNGKTFWSRKASSYQSMALGQGNLYISSTNGYLSAMDKANGASLWTQKKLLNRQLSAPAINKGYIIVGDYAGYVHAISHVDGSIAGRYHVSSSGIRTQPLVADNMLYIYTNSGKLTALTMS